MKANYEEDKVIVSATEPTGVNRKKVWFKKGKNLFNKSNFDWMWCFINGSTGEISQYTNVTKMFIIPIETGKIYTVSKIAGKHFRVGTTKTYPTIGMIVDNRDVNNNGISITISTGSEAKYLVCSYFQDGVDTLTATEIEATIQVEQNLTATAKEQYIEPEIYILNSNDVYEKFEENESKERVLFEGSIKFGNNVCAVPNDIKYVEVYFKAPITSVSTAVNKSVLKVDTSYTPDSTEVIGALIACNGTKFVEVEINFLSNRYIKADYIAMYANLQSNAENKNNTEGFEVYKIVGYK